MLRYRIDRGRALVEMTATGAITAAEVLTYQNQLRADPDFDPHFAQLADFSAADARLLDANGMRDCAANAPYGAMSPRAFVVSTDFVYGLGRMYEAFNELAKQNEMVRVFRDRESAMLWIESTRRGQ